MGKVETAFESLTPIMYSVQEDDGESLFLLSPLSGEFLLSRSLDFEAQRFYILTVVVQRGDLQVFSVRVYFSVLNVNDNPPVFSRDTLSASLREDTQVGTCFLSLNVSDKDDGKCTAESCGFKVFKCSVVFPPTLKKKKKHRGLGTAPQIDMTIEQALLQARTAFVFF